MIALHLMATAYGTRPSEILGISHHLAAYNLDLAALYIGTQAQNEKAAPPKQQSDLGLLRRMAAQ